MKPAARHGARDGARHAARDGVAGVAANERITSSLGAVLLVLLAAEGVTIAGIHRFLTPHVVIGVMLVPPTIGKMASTGYRFFRYYRGDPAYRAKAPPAALLRLLGPLVVVLSVVVLASGIALMLVPAAARRDLLVVHKGSFVLWFGVMTVHVLGHLGETARIAPRDWARRSRDEVAHAGLRRWLVAGMLALGLVGGILFASTVGPYLLSGGLRHGN